MVELGWIWFCKLDPRALVSCRSSIISHTPYRWAGRWRPAMRWSSWWAVWSSVRWWTTESRWCCRRSSPETSTPPADSAPPAVLTHTVPGWVTVFTTSCTHTHTVPGWVTVFTTSCTHTHSTCMDDRLRAGIPSRYVTSQLGQLSLASLRGRLMEYQLRLG